MGALVIVAALGGVACGDDDDDEAATPTTAAADFTAYCDASFDIETYFAQEPEIAEDATEAQIAAAFTTYLQGAKPLIDKAIPLVPAEIKSSIDVQVAAVNQALAQVSAGTVPDEESFEDPAVQQAEATTHAFDLKNCDWNSVPVTATDYAFGGLPDQLDAGRTSIDLTNNGKELHEIVLFAKNPGVTESFDEILALPEEEAIDKVSQPIAAFAPPGDSDYTVVDLKAGSYIAVCFIPQGLISQ
ncbi:MAG TPA: hypothetical protein VF244_05245, partial [Acidimicrobiales bacterium]